MSLSKRLAESLSKVDTSSIISNMTESRRETEIDWYYRMSASVLSMFDPDVLVPIENYQLSKQEHKKYLLRLLNDCTYADSVKNKQFWALKSSIRKAALSRFQSQDTMLAALAIYPDKRENLLQKTLSNYMKKSAKRLKDQSLVELRHSSQVVDWLKNSVVNESLPPSIDLEQHIAWRQQLEPFQSLVGDHFRGRKKELKLLSSYMSESSAKNTPPILIYGPGGMGKSTLIAKFILDQTDGLSEKHSMPFTYINFDRLVATPEEPLTLLIESARQLGIQYPMLKEQSKAYAQEWSYRRKASGTRSIQNNQYDHNIKNFSVGSVRGSIRDTSEYIRHFSRLLKQVISINTPFLFVLDTFEEVQFRSRDHSLQLSEFFSELRQCIPQIRIIIAGRAVIRKEEMKIKPMELKAFDEEASIGFLMFKGIKSEKLASEVFRLIGGNPLSLKLAIDLILNEEMSNDQQPSIQKLKRVLRKVEENNIQGQLYKRILEHIKDEEVRKLAHPGLTLRVVSVDLIQHVLAKPCGLSIDDKFDAQRLFRKLRHEVSLVVSDPKHPELLRHRTDVRALMLDALQNDKPVIVHEIHKAAIQYYSRISTPEARTEEIYHRLFVEADFKEVDKRWKPEWDELLFKALRPAFDEFLPDAQTWLAGRLGITGGIKPEFGKASIKEWERITKKRVEHMIYDSRFLDAYVVISERDQRSIGSPLYYYETLLLMEQKQWEEARRCVNSGIISIQKADNQEELLILLKQATRIEIKLGNYIQAKEYIDKTRLLLHLDNDRELAEIELNLQKINILRAIPNTSQEEIQKIRIQVLKQFQEVNNRQLSENTRITQSLAVEFATDNNEVLRRTLEVMTIGNLTDERKTEITKELEQIDAILPKASSDITTKNTLLRALTDRHKKMSNFDWGSYVSTVSSQDLTNDIIFIIKAYGDYPVNNKYFYTKLLTYYTETVTIGNLIGKIIISDIISSTNTETD